MGNENTASSQIQSFIVRTFAAARKQTIDGKTPLLESGIIDSLGMLDVVTFLEQTFGIKVEDEELSPENFANINCISSLIERKKAGIEVSAG